VAVAETDEQEVPTSETVFSLNANAHAWARVSLWENAIRDFERSVQLRTTDDAYDWLQLAIAYANLGQHEKAQEWLDRSEASISQGSSPNVELAELYDIARATVNDKQAIQE
jgi:tetratricopeptide (TPR) repeat protein